MYKILLSAYITIVLDEFDSLHKRVSDEISSLHLKIYISSIFLILKAKHTIEKAYDIKEKCVCGANNLKPWVGLLLSNSILACQSGCGPNSLANFLFYNIIRFIFLNSGSIIKMILYRISHVLRIFSFVVNIFRTALRKCYDATMRRTFVTKFSYERSFKWMIIWIYIWLIHIFSEKYMYFQWFTSKILLDKAINEYFSPEFIYTHKLLSIKLYKIF